MVAWDIGIKTNHEHGVGESIVGESIVPQGVNRKGNRVRFHGNYYCLEDASNQNTPWKLSRLLLHTFTAF